MASSIDLMIKSSNAHPVRLLYLNPCCPKRHVNNTTAYDKFIGQYAGSNKAPSLSLLLAINEKRRECPSVIFESGAGESGPLSISDSPVWLEGTGGMIP